MDFRRVTGYLHEGPKLQLRAFPLFLLWQNIYHFARIRKRMKSKEKKEEKEILIIFLGRIYRIKRGDGSIGMGGASLFRHRWWPCKPAVTPGGMAGNHPVPEHT